MNNYIAHESPEGLWSVANTGRVLCYLVPHSEAAALLEGIGEDADATLVQAEPATWFPTLLAGLEAETSGVEAAFGDFQERYESKELAARIEVVQHLLTRVAGNTDLLVKEIEQRQAERKREQVAAQERADREAELAPLRQEYQTLTAELKQLQAWLESQLKLLRTKSSFARRATMDDLAGTKQYARAKEIAKRLRELEGVLK